MAGRVTWKSRPGPEGGFGMHLPKVRAQYGDEIAEAVEHAATILRDRRGVPTAQDVKRTLRAIEAHPEAADLRRIDGWTEAHIARQAWRLFKTTRSANLTQQQLADCAKAALAAFTWRSGRMPTDDVAADLVRSLLHHAAALPRGKQDELLACALRACGVGHDSRNIERLREAAAKQGTFFAVT